jgi:hypothetical protein
MTQTGSRLLKPPNTQHGRAATNVDALVPESRRVRKTKFFVSLVSLVSKIRLHPANVRAEQSRSWMVDSN